MAYLPNQLKIKVMGFKNNHIIGLHEWTHVKKQFIVYWKVEILLI
jgi:hypothetical protein